MAYVSHNIHCAKAYGDHILTFVFLTKHIYVICIFHRKTVQLNTHTKKCIEKNYSLHGFFFLFTVGDICLIILPIPVIPLLNKKPDSIGLWLQHAALRVGARSTASLVWVYKETCRGLEVKVTVSPWPFSYCFTCEEHKKKSNSKKNRGGLLR